MNQVDEAQIAHAQREIAKLFNAIDKDIPLILFAQTGKNDVFNDAAHQAIRFFRQLTDKIQIREYDLQHEKSATVECPGITNPFVRS